MTLKKIDFALPRSEEFPRQDRSRNCWERDFSGGLMMSVLVSWRAGCVGTMGVKCWGGRVFATLLVAS